MGYPRFVTGAILCALVIAVTACGGAAGEPATPTVTEIPTPSPTATLSPVVGLDTPLLQAMAQVPLSFIDTGFWFGDMGRSMEQAGLESRFPSLDEVKAMDDETVKRYETAMNGLFTVLSLQAKLLERRREGQEILFDPFRMHQVVQVGVRPDSVMPKMIVVETTLDREEARQHLLGNGFIESEASGQVYYALQEDSRYVAYGLPAWSPFRNVYIDSDVVVLTAEPEAMAEAIRVREKETSTLIDDDRLLAVANALGDPFSAVVFTREALDATTSPAFDPEPQEGWSAIHEWDAFGYGMGWNESGHWMLFALHYPAPDAAEADGPELVKRMMAYMTRRSQPSIATFREWCVELEVASRRTSGESVLTVGCLLKNETEIAPSVVRSPIRLVTELVESKELDFIRWIGAPLPPP